MKKRKVALALLTVFAVIGVGNVGSCILKPWTLPSGGGQYQASPDGRYEFSASNLVDDAPWGRSYPYYRFEVKDLRTHEVVRTICIPEPEEEEVVGYRGPIVINWASDSSFVTVPVAEGVELTVQVP